MKLTFAVCGMALSLLMSNAAVAECKRFQSAPSNQTANVDFINDTEGNVKVGWFDFNGNLKNYRVLAPGQSYVQPTYTHHIWAATDVAGNCLGSFVVTMSGTFIIRGHKASGAAKAKNGKQI